MIKKTEIELYIEDTLSELLEAAKEGIATLIADVKKKAFMDAQEMMEALIRLDQKMKGETINEINIKDNHFKGGAAEKFAK